MNNKGPAVITKTAPVVTETPVNFPLILNCTQCGSRVRVARPGSFRCPSCKTVSTVDSNGKIEAGDSEPKKEVSPKQSSPPKQATSTSRRLRMEQILSEAKEEKTETVPEPEPELSASEIGFKNT